MRYRPDDAELLAAVAELLEDEVLGRVPPDLQHKVRVAANLARILARQQELEPAAWRREGEQLAALLGVDGAEGDGAEGDGDSLAELRSQLDRRLRGGDPALDERQVWDVLVGIARDDLATAKPGYDAWAGE